MTRPTATTKAPWPIIGGSYASFSLEAEQVVFNRTSESTATDIATVTKHPIIIIHTTVVHGHGVAIAIIRYLPPLKQTRTLLLYVPSPAPTVFHHSS